MAGTEEGSLISTCLSVNQEELNYGAMFLITSVMRHCFNPPKMSHNTGCFGG